MPLLSQKAKTACDDTTKPTHDGGGWAFETALNIEATLQGIIKFYLKHFLKGV